MLFAKRNFIGAASFIAAGGRNKSAWERLNLRLRSHFIRGEFPGNRKEGEYNLTGFESPISLVSYNQIRGSLNHLTRVEKYRNTLGKDNLAAVVSNLRGEDELKTQAFREASYDLIKCVAKKEIRKVFTRLGSDKALTIGNPRDYGVYLTRSVMPTLISYEMLQDATGRD